MTFLRDFLPTSPNLPMESGWQLWFDEFMNIWKVLSNGSCIEFDMFALFSRLAWDNIGYIDWLPHIEFLFSKFMFCLNLSRCFGEKPTKSHSMISLVSIAKWIVSNLGGSDGQEVLKYTRKMLDAIKSFFHPANAKYVTIETYNFVNDIGHFFIQRLHNERFNTKKICVVPSSKRLTDKDVTEFVEMVKPIAFHMLYSGYKGSSLLKKLTTLKPELIGTMVRNLLNDDSLSHMSKATKDAIGQSKMVNQIEIEKVLEPFDQLRTRCHQVLDDEFKDYLDFQDSNIELNEIKLDLEVSDQDPMSKVISARDSSAGMSTDSTNFASLNPLPEHLFHNTDIVNKNEESFSMIMAKFNANLEGLIYCIRPFVENYPDDVIIIMNKVVPLIDIIDIGRSKIILDFISSVLNMTWLFDDK